MANLTATETRRLIDVKHGVVPDDLWSDYISRARKFKPVTPPSNYSVYETPAGLLRAIAQRLRVPEGEMVGGFEMIYAHKSGEKVFVFVVDDGKAVTLEDDWTLFPSDRLVTQLRMLKG